MADHHLSRQRTECWIDRWVHLEVRNPTPDPFPIDHDAGCPETVVSCEAELKMRTKWEDGKMKREVPIEVEAEGFQREVRLS